MNTMFRKAEPVQSLVCFIQERGIKKKTEPQHGREFKAAVEEHVPSVPPIFLLVKYHQLVFASAAQCAP